uniref:Portal protein n=1 Tax=viral metagenome TaxID=1070528 RepID=A0A6M3KGJ6_9ZZZZ
MVTMTEADSILETASRVAGRANAARALWRERNTQMLFDRAIYNMTYKKVARGQELYLTNEARALTDKTSEVLAARQPIIRLPVTVQREPERRKMSGGERFMDGILREINIRWRRQGHNAWLADAAWYTTMGSVCIYRRIVRGRGGEVQFHADVWDPIQVFPVYTGGGLTELYRIYRTTPIEVRTLAQANGWPLDGLTGELEKDAVEITNAFWVEDGGGSAPAVYACTLVGGKVLQPPSEYEHWNGRIPVAIYPAGGTPYRGFDYEDGNVMIPDWPTSWGQPIFAANREVYKALDKIITWEMRLTRKYALPMAVEYTEQGEARVTTRDIETGAVVHMKVGEKLEYPNPPTMPQERREILQYLGGAAQRGGISNIAFGELGMELPGVAVERLLAATKSTLLPYQETLEFAISDMLLGFLEEFKRGGYGKVKLAVKQNYGGEGLQVFDEEFSAKDIPQTTYLAVQLPMGLPDNMIQKMTMARTAIPGNQPLLDVITIMEDILNVADPDLVLDRIQEMLVQANPGIQAAKAIRELRKLRNDAAQMGDTEYAGLMEKLIEAQLVQVQTLLGGASAPPGPVAARQRELPPGVQSPEESGASPDQMMPQQRQPTGPLMNRLQGMLKSRGMMPTGGA